MLDLYYIANVIYFKIGSEVKVDESFQTLPILFEFIHSTKIT